MNDELLKMTLSVAVPLWIERLRKEDWSYIQKRAAECGQVIAEKGDIILFKSKKPGETAKAFNALAEALACLAFAASGVTFMGMHWKAMHAGPPTR